MDVLSDILDMLQLRGTLYFRTEFTPPFSVAVPRHERAARFHLAVQGRCHVRIQEVGDVLLEPGDLIIIPRGAAHVLCDKPHTEPAALEDVITRTGYSGEGVLVYSAEQKVGPDAAMAIKPVNGAPKGIDIDSARETKLVCGHFNFTDGADHPLLRALPPYLVIRAELRARRPWLDELIRLIVRQVFSCAQGVNASVIRLTEAMFIETIQACADNDVHLRGVLDAIRDPRIGRALALIHREFGQDWTMERIAREAGMSRSRFAERFHELMGCGPMAYLTDIRLQKAQELLRGTHEPIQSVASRVGYRSAAAFSRAFSSRYGSSPSEIRVS